MKTKKIKLVWVKHPTFLLLKGLSRWWITIDTRTEGSYLATIAHPKISHKYIRGTNLEVLKVEVVAKLNELLN